MLATPLAAVLAAVAIAHATFSIVAVDSLTGEAGSAGASCVDYVAANLVPGRIGDALPGKGAINTQALYDEENQANARARMLAGDSPQQIIDWLRSNDVDGDPAVRQYGIVDYNQGRPRSAAFTGTGNDDYKGHRTGPGYSIQGNILLDSSVLTAMEMRFRSAPGSLACRLMAALQGAKRPGADSRCASNGTSALYAYFKVAKSSDPLDQPSLYLSVRTRNGARIEPIDSLQKLFDRQGACTPLEIRRPIGKRGFAGSLRVLDLQGRMDREEIAAPLRPSVSLFILCPCPSRPR